MSFASQFNFNKDKLVKDSTTISTELAQYVDHAYGFRKIHPDYTGFCCRVKRQDNEQADVYFDNEGKLSLKSQVLTWEGETGFKLSNGQNHFGKRTGDISIADFIGGGTGELTRIYDQGNAPSGKINLVEFTGYAYRNDGGDAVLYTPASGLGSTDTGKIRSNMQIMSDGNLNLSGGKPVALMQGKSMMFFEGGRNPTANIPSGLYATGNNSTTETFIIGSINSELGQEIQTATVGTYKDSAQWNVNTLIGGQIHGFTDDLAIGTLRYTGAPVAAFYYEGAPGSHAVVTGKGKFDTKKLTFFSSFTNRESAGFKINSFRQTGQFTGGGTGLNGATGQDGVGALKVTGKTPISGITSNNINPRYLVLGGPGAFSYGYNFITREPGSGSFAELIFSTQKLDSTKRFGIEKYMMDEFRIFDPTGMENLSDSQRKSIGVEIAIPNYGASIKFKSKNSSWKGSSFYNFTSPLGVNNLSAEIDLSFTLNKSTTRKLLKRLEVSTSGPLTGNVAFVGSEGVINFGQVKNNFQINLDTGYYQNFEGSEISSYNVEFISDDLYGVNLKLYNNRISPFLRNGTGYVANKLVAANLTTKKRFDVFSGNNTTFNSNVFDNYFYLHKNIGNKFQNFQLGGHPLLAKVESFSATAREDGSPSTLDVSMPASNLQTQGPSGRNDGSEDGVHPGGVSSARAISYLDEVIQNRIPNDGSFSEDVTEQITDQQSAIVSFKGFLNSLGSSSGVVQIGCVNSHPSTHTFGADGFGFYNPDFHRKRSASSTGDFKLAASGATMTLRPVDVGDNFEFRFRLTDVQSDLNPFGGVCVVLGSGENVSMSDIQIDIEHTGFQLDFSDKGPALKGLTTYTGFSGNATRTFFFTPDRQTSIDIDHSYRKSEFKNSFEKSLNVSRNQNNLGTINLTFSNRSQDETYAILHYLESHLGYKQFVYKYSEDLIIKDRVFYCDEWDHTFNYINSNTINAKFTEVVNPVTPNF